MSSVEVSCNSLQTASPQLKLGVACGDTDPHEFVFLDDYFECSDLSKWDMNGDPDVEILFDSYNCYTVEEFDPPGLAQTVPVGAYTDFRWSRLARPSCYTYLASPTKTPVAVPTNPPVSSPIAPPPTNPLSWDWFLP